MAGDNSIGGLGKGFFTKEGKFKTKEQLVAENKAAENKARGNSGSNPAAQTDTSYSSQGAARSALRETRKQTLTSINQALTQSKSAGEDISRLKNLLQDERSVLKSIREKMTEAAGTPTATNTQPASPEAIAAGVAEPANKDEVETLKQNFAQLESMRAELEKEIADNNESRESEGSTTIKVGNKTFGSFQSDSVKTSALSNADLSSAEGIKRALSERETALKDLAGQAEANRALAGTVREASVKALQEIKDIQGVLRSDEEATALSRTVSTEVVKAGAAALEAFNPTKLTAQIMSTLLA